jgi:hypothetical protein
MKWRMAKLMKENIENGINEIVINNENQENESKKYQKKKA